MQAYNWSDYLDIDTRFVVTQTYFKYEQIADYVGVV